MTFENLLEEYKVLINNDLKVSYLNGPTSLVETFDYVINSNGKRIRPLLLLLTSKIFNVDIKKALPAAISIELLHNFTLVHDDVMDNDKIRRGVATVHQKWDLGTAILSGDMILSVSLNNLIKHYPKQHHIINIFTNGLLKVCEGQALDKEFESEDSITIEDYLNMIDFKTGCLLGMCTEIGAIIANVDNSISSRLREYGILLGRAFQIQDDYLEIFSNSNDMGKSLKSDILLNKKTFLIILARQTVPDKIDKAILLSQEDFDLGIRMIREIIEEYGIKEYAKQKISNIFIQANFLLDDIDYDTSEIKLFSEYLSNRKR